MARFDHDPRWAETGDRYIIKLFRDHVFHQVDARGKPVLNLTHVFVNLNKVSVSRRMVEASLIRESSLTPGAMSD